MLTIMRDISTVLPICFAVFQSVASSSFYDNPEQDQSRLGPDSAEELHRKRDFEVDSDIEYSLKFFVIVQLT